MSALFILLKHLTTREQCERYECVLNGSMVVRILVKTNRNIQCQECGAEMHIGSQAYDYAAKQLRDIRELLRVVQDTSLTSMYPTPNCMPRPSSGAPTAFD